MDSDDEYTNYSGSRSGPLRILNLDDDATGAGNNRRNSRQDERGRDPRTRHPRSTEEPPQSRSEGRGGRRGNSRGRGSRGRRAGSRGPPSGLTEGPSDLRRYSSLSNLDTGSNTKENVLDTNPRGHSSRPRKGDSRSKSTRIFGYRKLSELSENTNSDDVLMELLSESSGFQSLLKNTNMQTDWSRLLLSVLGKACSSSKSHSKLQLVGLLVQENVMMLQVTTFLGKIQMRIVQMTPKHLQCIIQDVCKIMKELMQRMPQEVHSITSAVVMLNTIADDHAFNLQQNPDILGLIDDVSTVMKTILNDLDNCRKDKNFEPGGRRNRRDMESLPPPDDFRELPILPDLKDLQFNERPFLRSNKINGNYDSLHHYLDVQFRLLREDYIQPLRNGITEYRRGKKDVKRRFQDIRLYHKVKVVRPVCSNSGILHVIQFDVSKMQKMRWESSRRLLHGSLVCLSQDDFETILFATVTNRDIKLLQQGLIEVQFKNDFQSVFEIKPSEEFIMAETTAYFEAYRHILRGLQEIEDGLPMQQYIVECKQVLKPPKYLQNDLHHYDFSPLLRKHHSSEEYVPVINTRRWPSAAELQMDKSQYKALQMAVTKEMALIQGPPGTGKTFVGLKVMELLLHNSKIWRRSDDMDVEDTPNDSILVVCYTNHALDQFLEGVSDFCDSIVRIGGRCNNPALEPFMLSNLRKEARMKRQIPRLIWERKADCRKQMNELKENIEEVSAKLDASRLGIIHENTLELFMKEEHYDKLTSGNKHDSSAIQYWLSSDLENVIHQTKEETSTAAEYSLYSNWMDKVINGPRFEIDSEDVLQGNLWTKTLVERLYIYKQWVNSYISYKQKSIDNMTEEIQALVEGNKKSDKTDLQRKQGQLQSLQKDVITAETQVMSENALKDGLKWDPRQHLERLLKTKPPSPINCCVIEHWLHVDDTSDSNGLFAEAIETLASVTETIDTLEEAEAAELERNIVDIDEEENINQPKLHEEMLSRAMSDLAYTFTGGENKTEPAEADTHWQVAATSKNTKAAMRRLMEQSKAMSEREESRQPADLWTLSVEARFSLYKLWLSRYQDSLSSSVQDIVQRYSDISDVYQEVMDSEDVDIISGARVIAMTTTGAAKYRNILRSVNPKIIVVEEAAEVLESHIVSTINSNCQHLILIGDHKQLRPTPTVYQLAVNYNLEISLFERMIKNEMNYVTLELQHRMRPEISKHMRHIYPDLRDHPSVSGMKDILGVERNIYFIDHNFQETFHGETKSRSNSHEADFIVCLCKYLLQQGYKPTQVTVLTMYTGQVFALKKLMPKKEFEGVRVTAVDNYQGEENDIILLSLVRSNNESSVGFLKTDNRVCVGLSRAKMGFYVIGNFSLLCSQSNMWTNIVKTLKDNDAFGSHLTLRCQNHPEKTVKASMKSDFSKTPNGGCNTPCDTRLPCGHVCEQFCHIFDSAHEKYRCLKKCTKKICDKGHDCTKKCWQECGKCLQNVIKTIPVCGHEQLGPCHQDPHTFKCRSKCVKKLSCGHICSGTCGKCKESNMHQLQCPEPIQRKLICGHTIQCKCYQRNQDIPCTEMCTAELNCGHSCSGTCGGCFQGRLHLPCFEKCNQMLICGHRCGQKCGEPCPPCVKKCGLSCEHSKCSVICGKPCLNCREPCTWECKHQKCTKLCHELCDRIPCDMPCPKKLECGHSCSGLCGEVCPTICFYCDEAKVKEIFKDATPATRFIILVDCSHIIEKDTMDTWMHSGTQNSKPFNPLEIKQCPKCRKPILNSKRYGNIIKQSHGLINAVKQQLIGSERKIITRCQQMKVKVGKLQKVDEESFNLLMRKLEPLSKVTLASLEVIDIQRKLLQTINDKVQELQRLTQYQKIGMQTSVLLKTLRRWVLETKFKPNKTEIRSKLRETFTPQEQVEVREEVLRLSYVAEVIRCEEHSHLSGQPNLTKEYDKLRSILEDGRHMTPDLDEKLIKIFQSLNARDRSCRPIAEQRCIPKSMNDFAQRGRWQKCNEANHLLSADQAMGATCPLCVKDKLSIPDIAPTGQTGTEYNTSGNISLKASVETETTMHEYAKPTVAPIPKPRKKSYDVDNEAKPVTIDQERERRNLQHSETSPNFAYGVQTKVSSRIENKITSSRRIDSGSSTRISYDRATLQRLKESPHSHVFPPCLQSEDLSILVRPKERVTTEKEASEKERDGNGVPVRKTGLTTRVDATRGQNNFSELQWTEPKPVEWVEQTFSSQTGVSQRKMDFTPQPNKEKAVASEEAAEIMKETVRKRSIPSSKVIGGGLYNPNVYQRTDPRPVEEVVKSSHQQEHFTLTTNVKRETATWELKMEKENEPVGKLRVHPITKLTSQRNLASYQWTDPKPVTPISSQAHSDSTRSYCTSQEDVEMEFERLTRESTNKDTKKSEKYRWADVKPESTKIPQRAPEVDTGLEKTYDVIDIEPETDSANPPSNPRRQKKEILFQCIEKNCNQLEEPGLSGRCHEHYAQNQMSVLERIKKYWNK